MIKEEPPKPHDPRSQLHFKPYVPSSIQTSNRPPFKSPSMKIGGNNMVKLSSPVHNSPPLQFNSSLQMNTGQVSNPFNTVTYTNPNSSLKVANRPVTNQQQPVSTTQALPSFVKQQSSGQVVSPSHQTQPGQQFYWKKI